MIGQTDRIEALRRFYDILDRLSASGLQFSISETRSFHSWPSRGVYFVFEPGERRSDTGNGPRVVRVGHARAKEWVCIIVAGKDRPAPGNTPAARRQSSWIHLPPTRRPSIGAQGPDAGLSKLGFWGPARPRK
jgi:hypothetical protein